MSHIRFYYPFALVLGCAFTFLALELIGMGWQVGFSPLWLLAMVVSNFTVAYLFREGIAKSRGLRFLVLALFIGLVNVAIFSFIAYPISGGLYGTLVGATNFHIIGPLSLVAMFAMRWADRVDKRTFGRVRGSA